MKTFLFLLLAGYAVRCDDSNYYVVQMPENDVLPTKDFRVYWNVPTKQCKSKKIFFEDLYEKYGILQNTGDTFRGDKISILYDPGAFPALLRNSSSGEIKYRNGGVPQEGDLIRHLDTFQKVLEQSVPDKNFNGVGIIDFESWKPVLRQNFGILTPYKDVSYEIEKKRHWWWKKQWIEEEAKRRFEGAAREFMQATVSLAKKMRPHAVWGYYGFPYCFNMAYNNRKETCADKVPQENDRISWLWQESTALFPSVYSSDDITSHQLAGLIRGRVREAARVAARGAPILPYFWYRYRDKGYFTESDLDIALSTFYKSNASGFIIWGSSNDVNTITKCRQLKNYVTETLGPAIAKYTKRNMKLGDDPDNTINVVYNPNNASKYDPEYTWIPPVNYTQKIEEMVDKELKEEKEAALKHKDVKESILVDMILHKIANYCAEGCDNKSKERRTDEEKGDSGVNESRVVLVTEDPFKKNDSRIAVTVPTTTEEDSYDYDTTGDAPEEDIYETNEYIDISTITKSVEGISTTTSRGDVISLEESDTYNISKEENSTVDINNEVGSKNNTSTTKADNFDLVIEEIDDIDFSTDENNSTGVNNTETSTTTLSSVEPFLKETNTTESTFISSQKENSAIKNDLSKDENSTESNSLEVVFIDMTAEEFSTNSSSTEIDCTTEMTNHFTVDDVTTISTDISTVEPSAFENGTNNPITEIYSTTERTNNLIVDDVTATGTNSITVEPSAFENGTQSTTVEPSEFENGSQITTVEPSDIEDGTTAGTKSDSGTTLAPVLTEQVLGSVSRAIVSKPLACSLFYIYSISRCICVLFGNC